MKIFLIDRYNKNYDIVKGLQTYGIENVETKENTKIKATKNDVLILLEDSDFEALSKTTKVIWITKNKNEKDQTFFFSCCRPLRRQHNGANHYYF